ncbi:hypothetical protein NPIL_20841 [Nephila pilipes]|uniref:Uncharacterized protein n=1 Tax=Nephila pilipes TaxID=299642 RepID=A0A8X6PAS9_NEPPI|nr:hypothetical protein NPIL_20841 [Nephila pilipes]
MVFGRTRTLTHDNLNIVSNRTYDNDHRATIMSDSIDFKNVAGEQHENYSTPQCSWRKKPDPRNRERGIALREGFSGARRWDGGGGKFRFPPPPAVMGFHQSLPKGTLGEDFAITRTLQPPTPVLGSGRVSDGLKVSGSRSCFF